MKTWSYTQKSVLTSGITSEGLPFFESKLQGWNDDKGLTDIEDIVIVNAVISNEGAEVRLNNIFSSTEAMEDPKIRLMGEEIEQMLLEEVNLWLNGAN